MKRLLVCVIVVILLAQGPAAASTLSDFGTGQKEVVASLRSPGCTDIINITLPAECHVLKATMNVTTVAPDGDFPAGPVNATVLLDDSVLYSYAGSGYGGFGTQNLFYDGNSSVTSNLGDGGGNASTRIRLPKLARVTDASLELRCEGPKRLFELWNRTGPPGDFADMISPVGDLNKDGFDDFFVTAFGNDTVKTDGGMVFLYYGNSTLDMEEDLLFFSNSTDSGFSGMITSGDWNGDGYLDVAMGSMWDNTYGRGAGAVYIYFGGDPFDNVSDMVMYGNHSMQFFGYHLNGRNDFNNDGFDDLALNAQLDRGASMSAEVQIYFGSETMDDEPDLVFPDPGVNNSYGNMPSNRQDINADGYDDLIIGAHGGGGMPGWDEGRVYVYFGGEDMDNISDVIIWEDLPENRLGFTLSTGGDVNGDGYNDLAVGAVVNSWLLPDEYGRAFIYYGGPDFDNKSDVAFRAPHMNNMFGWIDVVGDVNEDGFDEVVISDIYNITNGNYSGAWYLYYGGNPMDTEPDMCCYGNEADHLGLAGENLGDVNGDGYEDFSIGAWANETTECGRVIIYFDHRKGLLNSSLEVAKGQVWRREGYFNGTDKVRGLAGVLNDYINVSIGQKADKYGNSFVEVPINISALCDGNLTLFNLSVTYNYTLPTIEFSNILNRYILEHRREKGPDGNITVPIQIKAQGPGRLKLKDLSIELDNAPALEAKVPDVSMNEDATVADLVDFRMHFKDDFDPDAELRYAIVSSTNESIVNVSILGNRFLSVDAQNGTLNDNWTGTVDIIVKCSDRWNSTTLSNKFVVTVQNVPDPPVFMSTPPLNATAGIQYSYQAIAVDGDLDPITYSLARKPPAMTIDSRSGALVWMPGAGGDYPVSITATDGQFNVSQNFTIFVPNQLPVIMSSPNNTAITTLPYEYQVNATDPDGDMLVYSLVSEIAGMSIDSVNGNISWTPEAPGDYTVKIMVVDGKGGEAFQEYLIHVYEKVEPTMEFVTLPEEAKVEGTVSISGKVLNGSLKVEKVQYRLDSGEWVDLEGTDDWELTLDTTKLKNGAHKLEIRVYDGQEYVEVTTRTFTVDNPVEATDSTGTVLPVVLIIGLAVAAGGLFLWKGRRPPDEEE